MLPLHQSAKDTKLKGSRELFLYRIFKKKKHRKWKAHVLLEDVMLPWPKFHFFKYQERYAKDSGGGTIKSCWTSLTQLLLLCSKQLCLLSGKKIGDYWRVKKKIKRVPRRYNISYMQIALPALRDHFPSLGTADTSVKMCRIFSFFFFRS